MRKTFSRVGLQRKENSSFPLATNHATTDTDAMKLFYTGPVINAEMLVAMLEKHGISATQEFVDPSQPDDGDLSRPANVLVPETEYDRAYRLFYSEREDEL
jgi:hypothetical protein